MQNSASAVLAHPCERSRETSGLRGVRGGVREASFHPKIKANLYMEINSDPAFFDGHLYGIFLDFSPNTVLVVSKNRLNYFVVNFQALARLRLKIFAQLRTT